MWNLLKRALRRLDRAIGLGVERTLLYGVRPDQVLPEVEPPSGLMIKVLDTNSARLLHGMGGLTQADVERRLQRGDICYVACLNGETAHYSWIQCRGVHSIDTAGTRHEVKDGEFWVYNCHTVPFARGKKIYPSILSRILRDFMSQGFSQARIYTTYGNRASQNGIRRAGFHRCCTLRSVRVGPRYFPFSRHKQL